MNEPLAGWYDDPTGGPGDLRWWDGQQWTEHVRRGQSAPPSSALLPPAPGSTTAGTTPTVPFPVAISDALRRVGDYSGRTSRSGYWWWALASFGVLVVLGAFAQVFSDPVTGDPSSPVAAVAVFVAFLGLVAVGLPVSIRRLHDAGLSGWMLLIGLIPLLGGLALLVLHLMPPRPPNRWGPPGHLQIAVGR